MRNLNEHIARRANKEDGCAGRFWEGRFKSQALLDEAGLLTCMAYVDLNPVRAGIATRLESSDFTSIQSRLRAAAKGRAARGLMAFRDQSRRADARLPMVFADYVQLVEWTGRSLRKGKGSLDGSPPALLARLRVDADVWVRTMAGSGLRNLAMIGRNEQVATEVERRGQSYANGQRWARALFREAA
jgi:putative transposase